MPWAWAWAKSELGVKYPPACRTKPRLSLKETTLILTQNRIRDHTRDSHQGLAPSLPVPTLILPDTPFVL